ncbi:MAG: DUF4369 domain-containing protein [Flavobacteriaceae bacterium]|nr:DUF4369 domain-containing protein [Flavobacteriaceae bacterium]
MKKLVIGFLPFLIIACSTNPNNEFQLNGITKDIEDGTVLCFDNTGTETLIDSAVVENNSFHFSTKLPKSPLQVVLRTKDFTCYRFL